MYPYVTSTVKILSLKELEAKTYFFFRNPKFAINKDSVQIFELKKKHTLKTRVLKLYTKAETHIGLLPLLRNTFI